MDDKSGFENYIDEHIKDHISPILEKRGEKYGDARVQFALAQILKNIIRGQIVMNIESDEDKSIFISPDIAQNWQQLPSIVCESLDMILLKITRIICGDYHHVDNYDDIAGYAQLAKQKVCENGNKDSTDT